MKQILAVVAGWVVYWLAADLRVGLGVLAALIVAVTFQLEQQIEKGRAR